MVSRSHVSSCYLGSRRPGADGFREAMRMAFADAHAFVADPKFSNVPVETMLSKVRSEYKA